MPPSYGPRPTLVKGVYLAPVLRPAGGLVRVLAALMFAAPCVAQRPAPAPAPLGLPAFAPINPVAASRSGLYFQPSLDLPPGRWEYDLRLDYASVVELNQRGAAAYTLDGEVLRASLALARGIGRRGFLLAEVEADGSYAGFLDGFLDWYHGLIGLDVPERERRPRGVFSYQVTLPGGPDVSRPARALFLGDLRLGLGARLGRHAQAVLSTTLPTSTGPEGYGRGTVSVSALATLRATLHPRLQYEGSVGLGLTPAHGRLAPVQREAFAALTSGLALRFWGRQWIYANLFYHSPYYHGTTLPALDRRELSLDFGWLLRTRGGREWRVGLTEDPEPSGPGVDLIVRLGARW